MVKIFRRALLGISGLLLLASVALAIAHNIFGGIAPDGMEYGFWMVGSAVFAFVGAAAFGILYLLVLLVQFLTKKQAIQVNH